MKKPSVFVDIKPNRPSKDSATDATHKRRVNLARRKKKGFSWNLFKYVAVPPLVIYMMFGGSVLAPIKHGGLHAQTITSEERAKLEKELEQLEVQIAEYERTISNYRKQGASLQGDINTLNTKINELNLKIKAINLSISRLDAEIKDTESNIHVIEGNIDVNKEVLAKTLQNIYLNDNKSMAEILLKSETLSEFFGDVTDLELLQDNLQLTLSNLVASRNELIDTKELLSLKRADTAALREYQASQKAAIASTKTEKDTLLKITKGKESEYQVYLQDTRARAAQIRSRIFEFLGGGQLSFETAYELAKLAEGGTGIRAALILAVLDKESALGANVGRCDYQSAMHPTRDIPPFLQIIKELGLEKDLASGIIKVSCPIRQDGAYGGAMGPAQFIPSTWVMYKDRIAAVTGNNPPSPWRNADAITGTALYLKDAYNSSGCVDYGTKYSHILPKTFLQERCAAAKYYAGGRWFTYRFAYGDPVLDRADRFEEDIRVMLARN